MCISVFNKRMNCIWNENADYNPAFKGLVSIYRSNKNIYSVSELLFIKQMHHPVHDI